jgi:hypothetical protein
MIYKILSRDARQKRLGYQPVYKFVSRDTSDG